MINIKTTTNNHKLCFINGNFNIVAELPKFVDKNWLLEKYKLIKTIRMFDKKAIALQRTGSISLYPSCYGQEATFIGVGSALRDKDIYLPYYRDQGVLIQRGVELSDILRFWGGFPCLNLGVNNYPVSIPIASQCPHAIGVAHAQKLKNKSGIVTVSLGDGATSKGDFFESLNYAAIYKVPVIFFINNNQWAISTPINQQTSNVNLCEKMNISKNIKTYRVDGNDIIAMSHYFSDALLQAESGDGPIVFEAVNYRLCDHTTADDASRYNAKEDLDKHLKHEPLLRLKHLLTNEFAINVSELEKIDTTIDNKIKQQVKKFKSYDKPPANNIFEHLYAYPPEGFKAQIQALNSEIS